MELNIHFTNCVRESDWGNFNYHSPYHIWSHLIIFLYCFSKRKVICNQTMTPIDKRTHASHIANEVDPQSFLQITFKEDGKLSQNTLGQWSRTSKHSGSWLAISGKHTWKIIAIFYVWRYRFFLVVEIPVKHSWLVKLISDKAHVKFFWNDFILLVINLIIHTYYIFSLQSIPNYVFSLWSLSLIKYSVVFSIFISFGIVFQVIFVVCCLLSKASD